MKIGFNSILIIFTSILLSYAVQAQESIRWINPLHHGSPAIQGKGWPDETIDSYQRLPDRYEDRVREPVWNLSKHSSGLNIRFQTNATNLIFRYQVAMIKS